MDKSEPPQSFSFKGNVTQGWKLWLKHFEFYLTATEKDGTNKVKASVLLMKKQSSPSQSFPGSALPINFPTKAIHTHMRLDHYKCTPNTKSHNILSSPTLISPPQPDWTIQPINPGTNFDYKKKGQISNYTNLFSTPLYVYPSDLWKSTSTQAYTRLTQKWQRE